ncbi:MAG TPA: FAD-binding oxidoreductase [Caulobacteraceae bacterium]
MKLQLPPRTSQAQFDAALKAFEGVVGAKWVLSTDSDRDAYSDIYAPGPETEWPSSAAVAPGSAEEVQAVVRLANEHKVPLWPVSRGKNLGYGSAAPRMPGTIVLDLGRLNRILELDPKLAYCVVEPGVSFFDLYDYIQRGEHDLWMSVPGNAWGSVIGNALDRGIGYTPYGLHTRNICGMEVVLPDGDLIRTGMGAMAGNHAWNLFPYGFGPSWDQAFVQSNMGVVTKMGMWLMPAPETSLSLTMDIPKEEDIGWVIDTLAPLKISGVIDQSIFIPSWLGKMVLRGQRKDFWDGKGAIPEWRVQELLKQQQLGYWTASVRLYGDQAVNKAKADLIKRAFAKHTSNAFEEDLWKKGDPVPSIDVTFGVPSVVPLQMSNWVGGRGAHMGFSPVVPPTSEHVLGQLKRSRARMAEFDFDFYASFTLGGRFANNINMLLYDRDNAEQVAKVRKMFGALVEDAKAAGYGEYRTHLGWMDQVADTFDFNNHALHRFNEKIKDALDPNGVIAPGKQGVWPSAYREFKA